MIFVLLRRTFGRPPAGSSRGQTMVEAAIVLPMFVLLMLGLFDLGRVVYAQHTLNQAAREAARKGVVEPMATAYKYGVIRSAAVSAAPGTGLTTTEVQGSGCADCFYPDGTASGGRVVVVIQHNVTLLTPLIAQVVGGSISVQGKSIAFIP